MTTRVGLTIAAEIIKDIYFPQFALNNWFEPNMFWLPKPNRHRFRDRKNNCHICAKANHSLHDLSNRDEFRLAARLLEGPTQCKDKNILILDVIQKS